MKLSCLDDGWFSWISEAYIDIKIEDQNKVHIPFRWFESSHPRGFSEIKQSKPTLCPKKLKRASLNVPNEPSNHSGGYLLKSFGMKVTC